MSASSSPVSVEQFLVEARQVAAFQGLDRVAVDRALDELRPHLATYAEISLTARGFEILTGAKGAGAARRLGAIAGEHGLEATMVDAFVACDAVFPDRMLGLKVCFGPGPGAPTLYHRTMAPKERALAFLQSLPGITPAIPALRAALEATRTVYGLAFTRLEGEMGLKLYTIGDVRSDLGGARGAGASSVDGFVSYRVARGSARLEVKRYLIDVAWDEIQAGDERWREIIRFARTELGYERAGYFGLLEGESGVPEMKLYVERIGAIPTEHAAR